MPCSICQHAQVAAIVEALAHDSVRTVAEQFGVSKSTLARHQQRCPTVLPPMGQAVTTAPSMGERSAPAHLVNPFAHAEAGRLADYAMRAYDVSTLRLVVKSLADLVGQITMDAGEG